MTESTPTGTGSNEGSNKMKKFSHNTGNAGVFMKGDAMKCEAMVPGMDKSNVFVYGQGSQVDKCLKTRKAFTNWVGTSKDCSNAMCTHLTKGTEPKFEEPAEPTPPAAGGSIAKPQMERHTIKLKKCITDEEEWTESKGRLFRTVFQLCAPALQDKLDGDTKCEDLEKNHDVN